MSLQKCDWWEVNQSGHSLQDKNIFFARFVSSQIHEDGRVFYAQLTSCAVRYDVIYNPSPINSQYLNTSGVDSPECIPSLERIKGSHTTN